MTLVVEEKLGNQIKAALEKTAIVLEQLAKRNEEQQIALDRVRLMDEAEAMAYLSRGVDTLLHYRKNGLPHYQKGRDVWYTKGDIDDWLKKGFVNRRDY